MNRVMQTKLFLITIILLVFLGSFLAKGFLGIAAHTDKGAVETPQRIVSMSPSLTEILFKLGLGDRVVGVTRYCDFPNEAQAKEKIGGFMDPNLEAIVAMKPDLIVLLLEHEASRSLVEQLGIRCVTLCHKNIDGIVDSIKTVGEACGASDAANRMVEEIRLRMREVEKKTEKRKRPSVMFVVQRNRGTGKLEDVYVAGKDGFFNKIAEMAGGRGVFTSDTVMFPVVSCEGIIKLNPEFIIEVVPDLVTEQGRQKILEDWQQVDQVEAVKSGRVYVFDDDFASIPGPRFALLLEKLARLLHPEAGWSTTDSSKVN